MNTTTPHRKQLKPHRYCAEPGCFVQVNGGRCSKHPAEQGKEQTK